jgi:hypothetical protein
MERRCEMKKIFVTFLVLALTLGLVAAVAPDPYNRHMPAFNVRMTVDGSKMAMHGDAMGSVVLTRGNMLSVIIRGLDADTFYSVHYGSDCVDFDKRTNRHGNLYSEKVEWDYSDVYEMRTAKRGGKIPTLKSGEAEKFEIKNFKCTASTGEVKLKGVWPKNSVRVLYS